MKRNDDLIRQILLNAEDLPKAKNFRKVKIEGFDNETIDQHLLWLSEAKLVVIQDCSSSHLHIIHREFTFLLESIS